MVTPKKFGNYLKIEKSEYAMHLCNSKVCFKKLYQLSKVISEIVKKSHQQSLPIE